MHTDDDSPKLDGNSQDYDANEKLVDRKSPGPVSGTSVTDRKRSPSMRESRSYDGDRPSYGGRSHSSSYESQSYHRSGGSSTYTPRNGGYDRPYRGSRGGYESRSGGGYESRGRGGYEPRGRGGYEPRGRGGYEPRGRGSYEPRGSYRSRSYDRGSYSPRGYSNRGYDRGYPSYRPRGYDRPYRGRGGYDRPSSGYDRYDNHHSREPPYPSSSRGSHDGRRYEDHRSYNSRSGDYYDRGYPKRDYPAGDYPSRSGSSHYRSRSPGDRDRYSSSGGPPRDYRSEYRSGSDNYRTSGYSGGGGGGDRRESGGGYDSRSYQQQRPRDEYYGSSSSSRQNQRSRSPSSGQPVNARYASQER